MRRHKTLRFFLRSLPFVAIGLMVLLSSSAPLAFSSTDSTGNAAYSGGTPGATHAALQQWLADTALRHAAISLAVMQRDKPGTIAALNPKMSIVPASVQKIVTTAAALHLLGPEHRFVTRLAWSGTLEKDGTLKGDLHIIGGNDPSLASGRRKEWPGVQETLETLKKKIAAAGIKRIEGRVVSDISALGVPIPLGTWQWDDIGNYYGAQPSLLCWHENLYYLYLNSGPKQGDSVWLAGTWPMQKDALFINELKAGPANSGDMASIYGGPQQAQRILKGTIPAKREKFAIKGAMANPALTMAQSLDSVLNEGDIKIATKGQPAVLTAWDVAETLALKVFDSLVSPPLKDMVFETNMHSLNLYAEQMLCEIGRVHGKAPSTREGAAAIYRMLKEQGLPWHGVNIYDGSGLSRSNSMNAEFLCHFLQWAGRQKWSPMFVESLPKAGKNTSMRNLGKGTPIEGNLAAKSGHMLNTRAYAGYVASATGEPLVFAVIVNNYQADSYYMLKLSEYLLTNIGEM